MHEKHKDGKMDPPGKGEGVTRPLPEYTPSLYKEVILKALKVQFKQNGEIVVYPLAATSKGRSLADTSKKARFKDVTEMAKALPALLEAWKSRKG